MFIEIPAHILTYILIDITYVSVPDCTAFYLTFPPNSIKLIPFCRFFPYKVQGQIIDDLMKLLMQYTNFYKVVSPIYCFVCSRLRLSFRPLFYPFTHSSIYLSASVIESTSPSDYLSFRAFACLSVCSSVHQYVN